MNFLEDEAHRRVRADFRQLVDLRNEYDPEIFFRLNQNILPQP